MQSRKECNSDGGRSLIAPKYLNARHSAMKPSLLSPPQIEACLLKLPGWEIDGTELVRTFPFRSYMDGIEFVNQAATAAEAMNHHPDLMVGWRKVSARITTHSAGGLTHLDVELASQLSSLVDSTQ